MGIRKQFKGLVSEVSSNAFSSFGTTVGAITQQQSDALARRLGAPVPRQLGPLQPQPVWVADLIEAQQYDQLVNPLGNAFPLRGNLNRPRSTLDPGGGVLLRGVSGRVEPAGSLRFGPKGLLGDLDLSTPEVIGITMVFALAGIWTLRLARVI